jgi:ABC-type proline/glycine betaine transport system ATPase subunit
MHEGRVVQAGPAVAFVENPADDYVREFFLDAAAVEIEREQ